MSTYLTDKYRPVDFAEVVGQQAVIKSLKTVLDEGLSHAFCFAGPSGVGKTTIARISACAIGADDSDLDEIDAATYTGIDAMRAKIQGLRYKPLAGCIKVLIVDECHRLSKQAWDSMLKSVEEPPPWVYWFFCTTQPEQLPSTIKTRCSYYDLKPVPSNDLIDLLELITKLEKFKVSSGVIDLCAKEARGSPRQAISYLGLCSNVADRAEAIILLRSAADAPEAVDLARALCDGKGWRIIRPMLEALQEAGPESIRHVVKGYVTMVMINSEDEKRVCAGLRILEHFSSPFNSSDGIAPVVLAVGRCLFT